MLDPDSGIKIRGGNSGGLVEPGHVDMRIDRVDFVRHSGRLRNSSSWIRFDAAVLESSRHQAATPGCARLVKTGGQPSDAFLLNNSCPARTDSSDSAKNGTFPRWR